MAATDWADNPTRPKEYELIPAWDLRRYFDFDALMAQTISSYTDGKRDRCVGCHNHKRVEAVLAEKHGVPSGFTENSLLRWWEEFGNWRPVTGLVALNRPYVYRSCEGCDKEVP